MENILKIILKATVYIFWAGWALTISYFVIAGVVDVIKRCLKEGKGDV